MSQKFFVTTPLYYVNAKPHIGHAYTEIASDVLARWHRAAGAEVLFLTGTDEHGQKIAKAAAEAGLEPKEFTDNISSTFKDLWKILGISYDDFIRTTEKRHIDAVQDVWKKVKSAKIQGEDVLYRHTYDGFYCVSCETFITDGLLDPSSPLACPECKKPLEKMKEETYFFRMSAYQDRLMEDIRKNDLKIMPESRRNEVLGFLEHNKLADLSVSRPKARLSWGIPIPFDPEHVTYVWFDALINYISACGYGKKDGEFEKWWPADVHIIGKDIIRHHAVIWPALLYALEIPLPKRIFAHGWWVQGGEKMSKSRGNAVDPTEIVQTYGIDAFRYFLLRETPFGQDGTFSEEALITRCNADLANGLGNLLSRTLTMCEKYFEGKIPQAAAIATFLADVPADLDRRLDQAELEAELVCPTCKTTLDQSSAPVAMRMKQIVRERIAAGDTKSEIKAAFVAQFGPAVLATPGRKGLDLLAWLLPLLGLGIAAVVVAFLVWRWSRRREEGDGPAPLDPELERRVDAELARYE